MKWYLHVLKNYANFKGRARRKEYWMFFLFNMIFAIIASKLDNLLGTTNPQMGIGIIYALYNLAVLVPSLAVLVRRLHDIGKSGWMLLVGLIPIVGIIWLFILLIKEGMTEENQYGMNPKTIIQP